MNKTDTPITHPIEAPTETIPSGETNTLVPLTLGETLLHHLDLYFANLGTQPPSNNLYQMVLEQVEEALLVALLEKSRYNQSKVGQWLGLSRGTTRQMMKRYGLLD